MNSFGKEDDYVAQRPGKKPDLLRGNVNENY